MCKFSDLHAAFLCKLGAASPTSAPAVFSVFRALFSYNPVVFLETAGFFQIATPQVLFLPSQQPPRKSPKLPARRAVVTAAGRARPRGFVLLRRLRLLNLPKFACIRSFSALAASAMLPHGGATRAFSAPSGYALGCVAKVAQTADTGATARAWRFACVLNLCSPSDRHISAWRRPWPASASAGHKPVGVPPESVGL